MDTIKLSDFIEQHAITADVVAADTNPHMDDDRLPMDHWRVTLRRPRSKMTVYFSMGRGHNGKEPTVGAVLDCLASDSSNIGDSFEDWCADYGYDTDSRKALRTFNMCRRQAERLRKFLGTDAYEALIFKVERE